MQGVKQANGQWFKTKKLLKIAVADGSHVRLLATSIVRDEYGGWVKDAPDGEYYIAGPDVYLDRRWYATITKRNGRTEVK